MKIIGSCLIRNEQERLLSGNSGIDTMLEVCDEIYVLDDHSTDNTVSILKKKATLAKNPFHLIKTFRKEGQGWAENELRQILWDAVANKKENDGAWLLCLDADETIPPAHRHFLRSFAEMVPAQNDSLAFRLHDMWSETQYREEPPLWTANLRMFPLMTRIRHGVVLKFPDRTHHCGRFPVGATENPVPSSMDVLHWAYSTQELREKKYNRYMEIDGDGRFGILAQYRSILDESPVLKHYEEPVITVLVGGPIHETPETFKEFLENMRAQNLPPWVKVDKAFIFHNCKEEDVLKSMLVGCETCISADQLEIEAETGYRRTDETHHFTNDTIKALTIMRNTMLKMARVMGYDYLFMVDGDIMLRPNTLLDMISAQKEVVFGLFWTKWKPEDAMPMPNLWDLDGYYIEETAKYRKKEVMPVGMGGAISLISLRAILKNISYDPLYNISFTMYGEDRAFCARCAAAGIQLYADTRNPAWHLYRPCEHEKYKEAKEAGALWQDLKE